MNYVPYGLVTIDYVCLFGQNNIELDINLLVFPLLPAASPPLSFYLPAPFSFLIPFLSSASLLYLFYTLKYPHTTAESQCILPQCQILKIMKNNTLVTQKFTYVFLYKQGFWLDCANLATNLLPKLISTKSTT